VTGADGIECGRLPAVYVYNTVNSAKYYFVPLSRLENGAGGILYLRQSIRE